MLGEKPIDFDRAMRWLIMALAVVGIYFLLSTLSDVLLPFFLAWLTAYMLNPMVLWVQKFRFLRKRSLAVILVLLLLLIFSLALALLLIPIIAKEFVHFFYLINERISEAQWPQWIPNDLVDQLGEKLKALDYMAIINSEGMIDKLISGLKSVWEGISGIYGVLGTLFGATTYVLYLIFILIDFESISTGWIQFVPDKYRQQAKSIVNDIAVGMNGYFLAQTKIVFSVIILFSLGFKLIGLPFGIMLGVAVGLMNYVPYLQIVGILPAAFLAVLSSLEHGSNLWWELALVAIVFAVVQLIQDIYLTPKFLGEFSGFNPAVILLSLSIWGALLGMIGLIIAIPLTSLLIGYYQHYLNKAVEKSDNQKIE